MAELVGCLAMSHSPMLLTTPDKWHLMPDRIKPPPERPELAKELEPAAQQAKWERCNRAIDRLRQKLDVLNPDVIVIVGDDQHENMTDDNMPPFTLFLGDEVEASLHFGYFGESPLAQMSKYKVDSEVALSLFERLSENGFDLAWSRKPRADFGLGHAFGRVLKLLTPDARYAIVPVTVNTFYAPTPSAARCLKFGQALGSTIRQIAFRSRIVVLGSGGLSHFRINEELDHEFIAAIEAHDTPYLSAIPSAKLVSGTSELRNWIIAAAAHGGGGKLIEYVPCYRTLTGIGCAMGFAYWH
jgi:hypothetical protein